MARRRTHGSSFRKRYLRGKTSFWRAMEAYITSEQSNHRNERSKHRSERGEAVDARNIEGSTAPHLEAESLAEEIVCESARRDEVSAPDARCEQRLMAVAHRRIRQQWDRLRADPCRHRGGAFRIEYALRSLRRRRLLRQSSVGRRLAVVRQVSMLLPLERRVRPDERLR